MKKSLLLVAFALLTGFAAFAQDETFVSTTPSNKNVVLEEYTGVNCGYCPDGHRIVNQIAAAHPGRVFPINIHAGSYAARYKTSFGTALMNQTGLTGFPAGTVNRHVFSGSNTTLNRGEFSSKSDIILNQASPVNVDARGTLDYSTRELNLTVQLYYTANSAVSTNMLNVAILQNNILGPQSGASYNPDQVEGNQYIHMHMLRHLITGQWGETINNTTAGSFVEKTYTYTIPEQFGVSGDMWDAVLEDLVFIVFVAEGHQEILTGCKATVTAINLPAIAARVNSVKEIPSVTCDNVANAYIEVTNTGANALTDLTVRYNVANGAYETFTWHGNIASMQVDTIHLPALTISTNSNQVIKASITNANGQDITTTEKSLTVKKSLYTCGGSMLLKIKTDQYGSETTFKIFGPNGDVVLQGGPFSNAVGEHPFVFNPSEIGCYRLEVYDSYGDGISGGYIRLYNADNTLIFTNNGNFDDIARIYLDVTTPASIDDPVLNDGALRIYPNPATNFVKFDTEESILRVEMFNLQGQMVMSESGDVRSLDIRNLSNGIYMLKVTTPAGVAIQKIVKE